MRTFFLGHALQRITAPRGCWYLAALAPRDVVGEAMVHVTMPGFVEPHGGDDLAQPRIGLELPIFDCVSGCRHVLDLSRVDGGQVLRVAGDCLLLEVADEAVGGARPEQV